MDTNIKGMDEFTAKLEQLKTEFPRVVEHVLSDEANTVLEDTKKNTPVSNPKKNKNSGTLKNGWQIEKSKFKRVVYNNTDYAAHVEWGHRIKKHKKEGSLETDGEERFVKGKYMLAKAIKGSENRLRVALELVMSKLLIK